jgi:SAM-dependent methyltransferase
MNPANVIADEQRRLWNGPAGQAWVDLQASLDRLFLPFEAHLTDAAASARRVLDVGCGTGATTLAVARRLGAAARCTGVDISEPMIALAQERAAREGMSADFAVADAQTHAFAPAAFDTIVSRFGVMFFDDPVRAFANLRAAATDDARLCCIAWRSAAENPFMTAAERAAAPLLPDLPPRRADAPGQFAFADAQRVHAILDTGGWTDIAIEPLDVSCTLPEAELARYFTRLGPVGLVLQQADEATRAAVMQTVRAAFDPYVSGDTVRFTAACWRLVARAA